MVSFTQQTYVAYNTFISHQISVCEMKILCTECFLFDCLQCEDYYYKILSFNMSASKNCMGSYLAAMKWQSSAYYSVSKNTL
jgi:hypothetical protein